MHNQENQEIQEIEEFALEYLFRVLALSSRHWFSFFVIFLLIQNNHAILSLVFLHMRCLNL